MNTGEWIATAGLTFVALAFFADRILKPWRERILAEAEEHRAVALIQSEEMRSAFRVLTGTSADVNQGVERVPSLGERMSAMEKAQQRVEKALNGGGLGSQMSALGAQVAQMDARQEEHLEMAESSKHSITQDIRETRRFVAEAVVTLTTNQQRLEERVGELDEKVEQRLFVVEDAERTHRAMLHEVGFDVDLPSPPDDAA